VDPNEAYRLYPAKNAIIATFTAVFGDLNKTVNKNPRLIIDNENMYKNRKTKPKKY
jgi:hypothetical protein